MSDETLLTASRRAVRNFNADMNNGGLITPETELAMETLDRMISLETVRRRNACVGCKNKMERSFASGQWMHGVMVCEAQDV